MSDFNDSWDFEDTGSSNAFGLSDISKGKGKGNSDNWDSWDNGDYSGGKSWGKGNSWNSWGGGNNNWKGGKGNNNWKGGGNNNWKGGGGNNWKTGGGWNDSDDWSDNKSGDSSFNSNSGSFGGKNVVAPKGKGKEDAGKAPVNVVMPPTMAPKSNGKADFPVVDGKGKGKIPFQPAPKLGSVPFSGKGDDGKGAAKGGTPSIVESLTNTLAQASFGGKPATEPAPMLGKGMPKGASHVPPPPGVIPGVPQIKGGGKLGGGKLGGKVVNPPLAIMPPGGGIGAPMMQSGINPELAALMDVVNDDPSKGQPAVPPHIAEKKPRIVLLVTRLAPDLDDGHMQQILEQCGEVQAWRRGRGANGEPLTFGFAQFGDPEAAWKVSTCLSKKVLCGQEVKVLIEEQAEGVIQAWRNSQQAALKVNTDEELEWELERKAVSCKALIDAKLEEFYGPVEDTKDGADGATPAAGAQRRMELLEREQARQERTKKRKAYRDDEFAKELARILEIEKRLRAEERDADDADRAKEEAEIADKAAHETKLAKMEELGAGGSALAAATATDAKAICELVDRVQAQPLHELFKMELNVDFLRDEKIFEKKLRPWLDRKVDLIMGGPQSDLVEYILRRVNACANPDALVSDLTRYLDDTAEAVVERMWRMLVLELTRGGFGLSNKVKKSKLE